MSESLSDACASGRGTRAAETAIVSSARSRLLCICHEFPPQTTPTGIRTGKLLTGLAQTWDLEVITATPDAALPGHPEVIVRCVPQPAPNGLRQLLSTMRLTKLRGMLEMPDDKSEWVAPALAAALEAIRTKRPDGLLVFMMPYAAGSVGLLLKRQTGLPTLMNFDDSPTCSDMHSSLPTAWHYRQTIAFEDRLVQAADAVVYVSQRNLERVRARQPAEHRCKFHLIRYGADPEDFTRPLSPRTVAERDLFRIVYIGGMNGWYQFFHPPQRGARAFARWLFAAWEKLGRYQLASIDLRGSSPVFIGLAVKQVLRQQPELAGKLRVEIYGNRYPQHVVQRVLENQEIANVVTVNGSVSNAQAIELARRADLLFMTLPDRSDGTSGGRISAKTYEYLMTDRPILGALPLGEGVEFLENWPGVWRVGPTDVAAMAKVVAALANLPIEQRTFDRVKDFPLLEYAARRAALRKIVVGITKAPQGVTASDPASM